MLRIQVYEEMRSTEFSVNCSFCAFQFNSVKNHQTNEWKQQQQQQKTRTREQNEKNTHKRHQKQRQTQKTVELLNILHQQARNIES